MSTQQEVKDSPCRGCLAYISSHPCYKINEVDCPCSCCLVKVTCDSFCETRNEWIVEKMKAIYTNLCEAPNGDLRKKEVKYFKSFDDVFDDVFEDLNYDLQDEIMRVVWDYET